MTVKNIVLRNMTLLTALLACAVQTADAATYTFGVVPQFEVRRLHQIWLPVLKHLEKETGFQFDMVGSPTIPAFESEFLDGRFDFSYMNPYHLVLASQKQGSIPIIRDTGRKLFGVLVVKKDSDIKTAKDLDGKTIAFPAPNALGASLQMRQELTDKFGLSFSSRYVKTHDSVYLNVLLGEVAAGGGVQKTLNSQQEKIKNHLKVIHKTTPVAPHPIAAHPRVPQDVVNKVKQALLKLGKSEDGRKILANIPIKQVGEATLDDYKSLNTMGLERFYVKSY